MDTELFTLPEMAHFVGVSKATLNDYCRRGKITPAATLAGRRFFTKELMADFIKRKALGDFPTVGRPRNSNSKRQQKLKPAGGKE